MFHAGSLEFSEEERARQAAIFAAVPTIVDVHLDRPAVLAEISVKARALLVSHGSSGNAFLDVVSGAAKPEGKLVFDLPSSTRAVMESREDKEYDTKDPLFRFGHGLAYNT